MAGGPLARFWARLQSPVRDDGEPTSSNGASSLHLVWQLPAVPLTEVSAVFELVTEPSVSRLYFWALQASFLAGQVHGGAAHLGLQWHPAYPNNRAVNWGGYGPEGRELDGSQPELPSTLNNPNTRDFDWESGVPYRLQIARSPDVAGAWRGTVTNLSAGRSTVVRDLYAGGSHLRGPIVWTEAFCRCEHPPVVARWSDLRAVGEDGPVQVEAVQASYQGYSQGGCTNTTARADDEGFLQITGTSREVPAGTVLPLL